MLLLVWHAISSRVKDHERSSETRGLGGLERAENAMHDMHRCQRSSDDARANEHGGQTVPFVTQRRRRFVWGEHHPHRVDRDHQSGERKAQLCCMLLELREQGVELREGLHVSSPSEKGARTMG